MENKKKLLAEQFGIHKFYKPNKEYTNRRIREGSIMAKKLDEHQLHGLANKLISFLQSKEGNLTVLQIMQVIDRADYILRSTQKVYRNKRDKMRVLNGGKQ